MAQQVRSGHSADIPSAALVGFVAVTFVITWGLTGFAIFYPEVAIATFGEINGSNPVFFVATWAPAIAAFGIVILCSGLAGMKAFLSRLFLWRCPAMWVTFIALGIPLVYMAGSLIKGGPLLSPLPEGGIGVALGFLMMMLILGPVEEFGWRGVAQPILQRHMAPLWAGIVIGSVWGIWHLPAFFLSGTVFATWNFLPFFVGNVVLAILVTPIFNRTGGSLLWPMLFHWQLINPFWPDAQPWDTWILLVVAVVVVWWNRATMLSRGSAVTEVVPERRVSEPLAKGA